MWAELRGSSTDATRKAMNRRVGESVWTDTPHGIGPVIDASVADEMDGVAERPASVSLFLTLPNLPGVVPDTERADSSALRAQLAEMEAERDDVRANYAALLRSQARLMAEMAEMVAPEEVNPRGL